MPIRIEQPNATTKYKSLSEDVKTLVVGRTGGIIREVLRPYDLAFEAVAPQA